MFPCRLRLCARLTMPFAAALLLGSPGAGPAQSPNPVTIALAPEAVIDDTLVYLDQIAKLTGGTAEARRRMAKLDVAELRVFAQRTEVASAQVKFRLLLAGYGAAEFRLVGARRVLVKECEEPITVRKMLACAESELRLKYAGDASQISIALAAEFVVRPFPLRAADEVKFLAKAHGALPRAGKARVDVSVIVNGIPREVVPVYLDITGPERVAGGHVQRMPPLRQAANVEPEKDKGEAVVKTRDFVKLIVDLGAARIEVTGEAMQDGRLGDTIRVRNVDSGRVVPGRVQAPGIVAALTGDLDR